MLNHNKIKARVFRTKSLPARESRSDYSGVSFCSGPEVLRTPVLDLILSSLIDFLVPYGLQETLVAMSSG